MSLDSPARQSLWTPLTGAAHQIALEVLLDGPLTRSELARRLDLSAGSLTRLSKPLLDSGLLVESRGVGDPVSGRLTRPLDVDDTTHRFVGVKLTSDTAYAVLTTLRAEVITSREAPLSDRSPAHVTTTVARLVRELAGAGPGEVRAVGVGLGGRVGADGVVDSARYLGWEDVAFGPALEAELGLPVVVDNDVLSLTRAEQWFGTARRCRHFAVVVVGVGIGYGLVVHDQLVDRPDAGVGLLGHHPLDPYGGLCPEGHVGCAEAVLTTGALTARAGLALRRPVTVEEVLDLASAGDPLARRVVDDAARALGTFVAAVGNFTMPERIVVSGENARLAEVGREAMEAAIAAGRNRVAEQIPVDVQLTGFAEWSRGAAVTAIQTFVLGTRR
ncbi:ROK family transcriptional regulator [Kineococcus rhizosphaerae]|uniref:Putative NBD/HSP70 family sugar kinase n=1 Tax=Kineococcus rhizosphaerae TaxID=559628 RepID=A0A2T0R7M3_9ACTN|nr:ROK family transcriptional regulator [Kineococcus rhizosphaerae]PRY17175.1 putative NBD/HSP70 family sugar kinase [Kineococcus rhizosphaerae]